MIYIYIVIIMALVLGAIMFFPFYAITTAMLTNVSIPTDMGGDWMNFLTAFRNWYLFLVILLPLLVYVFVQSQKPRSVIIEE